MDQHPIPQDVTGFQFKLIGAMTVKQFGYIALGVIMAVILYYLPLKGATGVLLKIFLIPAFGIGGVVIAFVPIEGRPIDTMASNFFKAMFAPNQYVYRRAGRQLKFTTIAIAPVTTTTQQQAAVHRAKAPDTKQEQIEALIYRQHDRAKNELDQKETQFLKSLSFTPIQAATPAAASAPAPIAPAQTTQAPVMAKPIQASVAQAAPIPPLPSQTPPAPPIPQHSVPVSPQPNLQPTAAIVASVQKPQPVPTALPVDTAPKPLTPPAAPPSLSGTTAAQSTVRPLPQGVGLLHVSDTPNVVMGLVKDPRGNVLHGILVEIKDAQGNPVRAFKTNQLGQFASATTLAAGIYTIELEDPKKQHSFDKIQLIANNQILTPIEITSHDAREELRRQLFN